MTNSVYKQALPQLYTHDQSAMTDLIDAYYLWQDNLFPRDAQSRNIDQLEFVDSFLEEYAPSISINESTNKKLLLNNIVSLYKAKGTPQAFDLFFRIVYGVGADINLPSESVFRLSDGAWTQPLYFELDSYDVNLQNQLIKTNTANGYCEQIITRQGDIGNSYIAKIYQVTGEFNIGDVIRLYGDNSGFSKILGSLDAVSLTASDVALYIGTKLSVTSDTGVEATAVVTESKIQPQVEIKLEKAGYGYTQYPEITISDSVLILDQVTAPAAPSYSFGDTAIQNGYYCDIVTQQGVFTSGSLVTLNNVDGSNVTLSSVAGTVVGVEPTIGLNDRLIIVSSAPQANVISSNTVIAAAANTSTAAISVFNSTATVVGSSSNQTLRIDFPLLPINTDTIVYQFAAAVLIASGTITKILSPTSINVDTTFGAFRSALPIQLSNVSGGTSISTVTSVTRYVGITNQSGQFYSGIDTHNGTTVGSLRSISTGTKPSVYIPKLSSQLVWKTAAIVDPTYLSVNSVIPTAGTNKTVVIGNINEIAFNKTGIGHIIPPIIDIRQPMTAALNQPDTCVIGISDTSKYIIGEDVHQTGIASNTQRITVASLANIIVGDLAATVSLVSPGVHAVVQSIDVPTKTVYLRQTSGAIAAGLVFVTTSGGNTTVSTAAADTTIPTACGSIVDKTSTTLTVKVSPLSIFSVGATLVGISSGTSGTITSSVYSGVIIGRDLIVKAGINFKVNSISKVSIVNSGYNFKHGEKVKLHYNNQFVGEGTGILSAVGRSGGYFDSSKGQLDGPTSLYDGDYYQDFSYEIESPVPFDKYKAQVLANLHPAGTKAFGKVSIDDISQMQVTATSTEIIEV